jgi:DNA adenine methylase
MRTRLPAKLRPPIKWHGGKSPLARRIVALLPNHRTYVEPFAGGLSVLLNKRRSHIEVAGDRNFALIQFFSCLRDRPAELTRRLGSIPYSVESFRWACEAVGVLDPIEQAAAFLVKHRFSRGAFGRSFAWSDRLRGGQPGDANAWATILERLPAISARLQGVELYQGDALDLVERFDTRDTLFYLDPPYVRAARTARDTYKHEMSDEDHVRLLDAIAGVRGMVVLSGYHSPLYDHALGSWERHEFERPNDSGQTKVKTRRVEVVWLSPNCDRFELRG